MGCDCKRDKWGNVIEADSNCLAHTTPMTTHENTPEVVESWRRKAHDLMIDMGGQERQELLHYISSLLTSQKQKQIEEIQKGVDEIRTTIYSDTDPFYTLDRVDDLITKIQAL